MKTIRRRRRQAKTDYKARLALIKSEKPRIIIRKTNRYILAQLVQTEIAQDKVITQITSKDLLAKGWPKEKAGSLKSIPAAYLTGLLLGNKIKGDVKEAILDMGLQRNMHKSRIYACLKGLIDAGINIPHNEAALPNDEELKKNEELAKILDKVKEEIKWQ